VTLLDGCWQEVTSKYEGVNAPWGVDKTPVIRIILRIFIIETTLTSSRASAIFDKFSGSISFSPGTLKHCNIR